MEKVAHEREQQHHVSTKLITVWAKNMAAEKGLYWICSITWMAVQFSEAVQFDAQKANDAWAIHATRLRR